MSVHPSLKVDAASSQQRSVLTRIERIKDLMQKGLWAEESRVYGLPKTKIVRVKTAKKKAEETEETPEAAGTEAAKEKETEKPAA